jgi:hypothetical protein
VKQISDQDYRPVLFLPDSGTVDYETDNLRSMPFVPIKLFFHEMIMASGNDILVKMMMVVMM